MASVVPGGTTVKLDRLNIRRVAALTSLSLVGGFRERVNISEVDFQWVPRRRRSIDVEVRALALLRMMRIYCPLGGDTPGMFVATHPRVIRGPNFRRFIGRVGLLI